MLAGVCVGCMLQLDCLDTTTALELDPEAVEHDGGRVVVRTRPNRQLRLRRLARPSFFAAEDEGGGQEGAGGVTVDPDRCRRCLGLDVDQRLAEIVVPAGAPSEFYAMSASPGRR